MDKRRCIVIGSSPETEIDVIRKYLSADDFIACADGGYLYARRLGIRPDLIVGDFDSAKKPKSETARIISLPVRKDDTDTVSVIHECLSHGFDEFLLFGMTGGYIIGFLFTALIVGFMCEKLGRKLWVLIVSMTLGLAVCYLFGTVWFMVVYTQKVEPIGFVSALGTCVVPYLLFDAAKIGAAAVLVNRLDKIVKF